jgi:hypothetical protein
VIAVLDRQMEVAEEEKGTRKRILGVVASLRQGGNSDALARVALRAAAAQGAATDLVLLGDLRIGFCDGCLSCVFRGGQCHQDDDVHWLYETVAAYDGLILTSCTYLLTAPAQVKALIDRGVAEFARTPHRREIPVGVVGVAGLPEWDYFVRPTVNQLGLLLGGRLVGSLMGYAPGPSETLLDETLVRQVEELALAVVSDRVLPAPAGVCPICYLPRPTAVVELCPFCRYDPQQPDQHRFTAASLSHFLLDWMLPSRERFLARRSEIKAARASLAEFPVKILKPERPDRAKSPGGGS